MTPLWTACHARDYYPVARHTLPANSTVDVFAAVETPVEKPNASDTMWEPEVTSFEGSCWVETSDVHVIADVTSGDITVFIIVV